MKFSPKQMLIKKHVKTCSAWTYKICAVCHHHILFETMYKVGDSFYCMDCCQSKEKAFDATFPQQVTPADIIIKQEKEKVKATLFNLLDDIQKLKDGEVSPSVMSVLLKHSPEV